MNTFVALLRAINVSGQRSIRMADLQTSLQAMGLAAVKTYLQSGNVVFASADTHADPLATRIKSRILADFGHEVEVLVFSAEALRALVAAHPWAEEASADGARFHACVLFQPPAPRVFQQLTLPLQPGERARLLGQAIYLDCPQGYGKTKLNNAFFEKKLSLTATTRNWRTLLALVNLCSH